MKFSLGLAAFAATLTSAFALPSGAASNLDRRFDSEDSRILLTNTGHIFLATHDGENVKITMNESVVGDPSWVAFVAPNKLYAVDEFSAAIRYFNIDLEENKLELKAEQNGSLGVVHLEFNKEKTRMVGSAYGNGTIDVWDIEGDNLKLIKTLPSAGGPGPVEARQASNHPHQAVLDPSGRFFAINDLGSDSIIILDSKDDAYIIPTFYTLDTPGCGPRHGAFYPSSGDKATHYILVCEISNEVQVLSLEYTDTTILFTAEQNISTFGVSRGLPPANWTTAAAGELILSPDDKDVYISNRVTGNETDSIAHFTVDTNGCGDMAVRFSDSVSTGGINPRMMSFSKDGDAVLLGNLMGTGYGLVALTRGEDGKLDEKPAATIDLATFGGEGFGPKYVMQLV